MTEYLQIGYKPDRFQRFEADRKTAVDPKPTYNKWFPKDKSTTNQWTPFHHIFLETFLEFASYIPNKYDIIEFTYSPTMLELRKAKQLLNEGGEIVCYQK